MVEKLCGIYKILSLINGKVYIGQSKNIKYRLYRHKHSLKYNKHYNLHLQNTWNLYGENNFTFEIIYLCNESELDIYEKLYIKEYKSYNKNFGYNHTYGGEKGIIRTSECIKNMKDAQNSIPIYQIDLESNIINQWYGAREASKQLNISQACIWQCVNHNRLVYKGFIWITKEEYKTGKFDIKDYINKNTQPRKIVQLDENNNIVKIWQSINSIHKELGYDSSYLAKRCKQKTKLAYNCKWMYLEDYNQLQKVI